MQTHTYQTQIYYAHIWRAKVQIKPLKNRFFLDATSLCVWFLFVGSKCEGGIFLYPLTNSLIPFLQIRSMDQINAEKNCRKWSHKRNDETMTRKLLINTL